MKASKKLLDKFYEMKYESEKSIETLVQPNGDAMGKAEQPTYNDGYKAGNVEGSKRGKIEVLEEVGEHVDELITLYVESLNEN